MINRREFAVGLVAAAVASRTTASEPPSKIEVGLELYSFRDDMKRDVPRTLARVREMGFKQVEIPNLYGLTAIAFRHALDKADLQATALVAPYEDLKKDIAKIEGDLETLGVRWAILPWIPHGDKFERSDVERASKDMNAWGSMLTRAGYKFAYHPHGYEFQASSEGTLFDALAHATDAETVKFELDTFWIVWPGQNCVELMKRYPTRFRLLHLKDLRKGVKTGDLTGMAPEEDSVAVGDGVVPWNEILALAKRQNFEAYYLEDESPDAATQIPRSLKFISTLRT
jgi:sugar phosphate isomerase/epimerase